MDKDKIIIETLRLLDLTGNLEPGKMVELIKEQDDSPHFRRFADAVGALAE